MLSGGFWDAVRNCELLWEYYKICDALGDFCGFADVGSCQDWFSRSETDADGGAKVLGEHVGSGSYYSRVVRAEAKRVHVEE